jgi:hypothetical protein
MLPHLSWLAPTTYDTVLAFTSATEGSGSQAEVFRVDNATCFHLHCLGMVGSFGFVLPSGPTAAAAAVFEHIIDSTSPTTEPVASAMPTTRSPEIKLAIGTLCPLPSAFCPVFGCEQGLLV